MLTAEHVGWLEARGLDLELVTRLGWHTDQQDGNGRTLVIPLHRHGEVVNRKRRLPGKKFLQDAGAPPVMFNEDCLRDDTLAGEPLIITEGEIDCVTLMQAGFQRTVSVPNGAGSDLNILGELEPLLKDIPRIILAVDGDEAGLKLREELARRLGPVRCATVSYPAGTKDANEVLLKYGENAVRELIAGAKDYPVLGLFELDELPDQEDLETYDTEWENLNRHMRPARGSFIVITGIPSHGKSLFSLHLLASLARLHGHVAALTSFEAPIKPIVHTILRRYIMAHDQELDIRGADDWIRRHFVFIADPLDFEEQLDLDWVLNRASDAVVRRGIRWLLLDPWNQIEHKRRPGESEVDYQGRAIRAMRRFARVYGVGIVVTAHPTKSVVDPRTGETRVPGLYDVSGSAHWYNGCDVGLTIHRPSLVEPEVNALIHKVRFTEIGLPGDIWLRFDRRVGRFYSALPPIDVEHAQRDKQSLK